MMTPAEKAVTCVTVARLIRSTALIPAASTACCLGLSPAIPTLYHGHGDLAQPLALQPSEPMVHQGLRLTVTERLNALCANMGESAP